MAQNEARHGTHPSHLMRCKEMRHMPRHGWHGTPRTHHTSCFARRPTYVPRARAQRPYSFLPYSRACARWWLQQLFECSAAQPAASTCPLTCTCTCHPLIPPPGAGPPRGPGAQGRPGSRCCTCWSLDAHYKGPLALGLFETQTNTCSTACSQHPAQPRLPTG